MAGAQQVLSIATVEAGTGDYVRGVVANPVLEIAGVTVQASLVEFEVAAGDTALLEAGTDPDVRFNRDAAFDPALGPELRICLQHEVDLGLDPKTRCAMQRIL